MSSLQVLFEDNHCLAVNKPPGLPTQAPPHIPDCVEQYARAMIMKGKGKTEGRVYLGIPHRLDRPASGIVLFAKSSKAAARIAEQFREHQVRKTYWAVVPTVETLPPQGQIVSWVDHVAKIDNQAKGVISSEGQPGAKLAQSEAVVLARETDFSLIELRPTTGRMHQLRLQCASRGFPILGDITYGSALALGNPSGWPTIALHARALEFAHPIRFEPIRLVAPVPILWERFPLGEAIRGLCFADPPAVS